MNQQNKKDYLFWILLSVFSLIELTLYIGIEFVDYPIPLNILCYFSVVLCFVFGCYFFLKNKTEIRLLIVVGLFFTIISDFFLVFLNESLNDVKRSIAMSTFTLAQFSYATALFLQVKTKNEFYWNIGSRIASFVILEIVAACVLKSSYSYLIFISLFYFSQLLMNIVISMCHFKINPLFALGLLFFIGCDLTIGFEFICSIFNLGPENILYRIAHSSFGYTWLFYLPSQVMLSLSIYFGRFEETDFLFKKKKPLIDNDNNIEKEQ